MASDLQIRALMQPQQVAGSAQPGRLPIRSLGLTELLFAAAPFGLTELLLAADLFCDTVDFVVAVILLIAAVAF